VNVLILRPGELATKGKNRPSFERRLLDNLRAQLRPHTDAPIERTWGRFYVGPTEDVERLTRHAQRVFGIVNVSPALRVDAADTEIKRAAVGLVQRAVTARGGADGVRFRVTVKRADKDFPISSMDYQRELGAEVFTAVPGLRVDLENADIDLGVEIRREGAFLYVEKFKAPGGLPVGYEGRAVSLLSGGIDSPVASWLLMRRGCRIDFVHFDSRPYTGPGSLDKVRTLAATLGRWQAGHRLFVVPFAECQLALKDLQRPGYRTVLYRRFMLRMAERIAMDNGAGALVTGDSLGQVASQTLANLRVVDAVGKELPILRPLVGQDKQDVVALARQIGTYDISIRPFEDCCTLFAPDHPVTRGKPGLAAEIEEQLDVEGLVADAVARTEMERS
jgi:thiamine biosynthesis protein ThiI